MIGLIDEDLITKPRSFKMNLEIMKLYSYYNKKNIITKLITKSRILNPTSSYSRLIATTIITLTSIAIASAKIDPYTLQIGINIADNKMFNTLPVNVAMNNFLDASL